MFMTKILDFLFPPSCPLCGDNVGADGTLCAACWGKINWIGNPKCWVCGYPFPADMDLGPRPLCPVCAAGKSELDWLRSACVYDAASREIMLPFKHSGTLKFGRVMSNAMIGAMRDFDASTLPAPDLIIPVPLAYFRIWKRGYNQAAVLARPIAAHLEIPVDVSSVRRTYRRDMGHLNQRQRRENIKGVFHVRRPKNIVGKNILIVDDVMTTGATFSELRRVLKRAGAANVYGISFCRVVKAI